uniref:Endoplasmic reticulum resident protein 29 n=1 Tax=Daphnia galeata TaxID=27404 RepID=A0A8J2S4R4_9CRUS|nr:unnamed protein product [Daphnia galeata]
MSPSLFYLLLTIISCLSLTSASSNNCQGCVQLDSYSFEKVVSKFKASIVKIDVAYPYGEKHEQFGKLSAALSSNPDILVAEVGVKDYGDKENVNIAERYNIVKEEYPVMLLFTEGKTEPIRYQGEFKLDMMQRFVSSTSGLWIGLPGCLEVFDGLANRFVASNPSDRKEILRHSEDEWDKVSLGSERKSAEVYVKVMRKMLEKGDDFLQLELSRVDTLRKGKLAKEKKEEMDRRLNILQSFQPKSPAPNTEL